jgi:hypothetical protein
MITMEAFPFFAAAAFPRTLEEKLRESYGVSGSLGSLLLGWLEVDSSCVMESKFRLDTSAGLHHRRLIETYGGWWSAASTTLKSGLALIFYSFVVVITGQGASVGVTARRVGLGVVTLPPAAPAVTVRSFNLLSPHPSPLCPPSLQHSQADVAIANNWELFSRWADEPWGVPLPPSHPLATPH